jgi:3-mercaptopyruvate sulfurtransferase SseA
VILSEENNENIRPLDGGLVHWRMKKFILVILSEENHENIRPLDGGLVHWRTKKAHIGESF